MPKAVIALADADRERLGAPETLEVDIDTIDIDELIEIEDVLGLTLVTYLDNWPSSPRTMKATVWLGLRRAGIEVSLKDLKFNAYAPGARYRRVVDDEPASAGKAEADDTPSTPPADSGTS